MSDLLNKITKLKNEKAKKPTYKRGYPSATEGDNGDISFRATENGLALYAKINNEWFKFGDGLRVGRFGEGRKYTNSGKWGKDLVGDNLTIGNKKTKLDKTSLKTTLELENVTNESKATMFTNPTFTGTNKYNNSADNIHKFFTADSDENTLLDIVTALKSPIIRFMSGDIPRWKIGFDTDDTVNKFKIDNGTGTTLADPSEFELDNSGNLVLSGTLTSSNGVCSGTGAIDTGSSNITTTGTISFGSLTDSGESITITKFVDEADTIVANDNDTTIPTSAAVKAYTDTATAALVDSAPAALNTLNELAAALNDDANFATTVTNSLATKLPLAGGTMTGDLIIAADNKIKSDTDATWNFIEFDDDSGSPENQTLISSKTNTSVIVDGNNNGTGQFEVLKGGTDSTATELFRIENDGDAIFTGDVYLSGEKKIQFDSADTSIYTNSDNPEDLYIESDEDIYIRPDDNLVIAGGTTNYVTFDGTNQRVGIGTTSPGQGLHVVDTGAIISEFESSDNTTAMIHIENSAGEDGYVGVTNDGLVFSGQDYNSNNMIVDTSGNVGIGTTSPDANLQIHSTSGTKLWLTAGGSNPADAASLRFAESENGNNYIQLSYDGDANELSVDSNNQNDMTVWNRANNRVTHSASTRFYRAWPQVRFSDDSGTDYVDGGLSGNTFLLKTSDHDINYQWQNNNADILMSIDSQEKTVTIGEGNQSTYALKIGNGGRMNMPLKGLEFEHNHGYWNALGEFGLTHYLTATQNDLIRHRTPLTLERWNGSAYVDAISGTTSDNNPTNNLQGLKNILDGSRTTAWQIDDEWRKFRFVITRQQSWAEENLIYLDLGWSSTNFNSGSSASGSMCPTLTIEQLHLESGETWDASDDSNNDWTTNATITSDWHSTGIASQYGTFFIFNNSTHHSEVHVRITVEFPAWDASAGGNTRLNLRNVGMLSQSASARNTEVWTTNWDRDATGYGHVKIPDAHSYYINNVAVLGSTTLGSGVVNSSLTSVGTLTSLTSSGVVNINGTSGSRLNITNTGDTALLTIESQGSGASGRSNIKFNTNGGDWELGARNSNGSPDNSFYIYENGSTAYRLVIEEGGHVGIGTTNPNQKLDVAGSIQTSANLFFNGAGTHYLKHNGGTASSDNFTFRFSDNEDVLAIRGDGRVGINDIAPSEALDVSGNIAVTGTVDGVDIAARDAVLTSTTTTANAALPKAGGTMTGDITFDTADSKIIAKQDFIIKLDKDTEGTHDLILQKSNGSDVFKINELGEVNLGKWKGTAVDATYVGDLPTSKITSGTFDNARIASSNVTQHQGDITGTGALDSGSITSGFGNINNGSSTITTTGAITGGDITANGDFYGRSVDGEYSRLYRIGGVYFTWDSDSYGNNFQHSITSYENSGFSDGLLMNSFGDIRINIDSNNNNSASTFEIGHNTDDTSSNTLFTLTEAGVATFSGEVEAASLDISGDADIDGNLEVNGLIKIAHGGPQLIFVDTTDDDDHKIQFWDESNNTVHIIRTSDNTGGGLGDSLCIGSVENKPLQFITQNTTRLVIDGSGIATFSGEVEAASLDISGDADIDGTLEADAITVNGSTLASVIEGTTVTNATNATHVSVADNENTNENNLIPFIENQSATGNVGLESDGDLYYNPSSGAIHASEVVVSNVDAVDGDFDGTLEADAITIGGVTLSEYISDTVGAMFSGNTETRISATYDDSDNTIDLVVDDMTAPSTVTVTANSSEDATHFIAYADGVAGAREVNVDAGFTYNPSSGLLSTAAVTTTGDITVGDDLFVVGNNIKFNTVGSSYIEVADASGTNAGGADLYIEAGASTGSGNGGEIIFRVTDGGSSGSSVNSHATAVTIHDDKTLECAGSLSCAEVTVGAPIWVEYPFVVTNGVTARPYYRDVDDLYGDFRKWDDYDSSPTSISRGDVAGHYVVPDNCTLKHMRAVVTNTTSDTDIIIAIYHGTPNLDSSGATTLALAGSEETVVIGTASYNYSGFDDGAGGTNAYVDFDVDLDAGDIIVPMVEHNGVANQTFRGNITLKLLTR